MWMKLAVWYRSDYRKYIICGGCQVIIEQKCKRSFCNVDEAGYVVQVLSLIHI